MSRMWVSGVLLSLVVCWAGAGVQGQEKAKAEDGKKHFVFPVKSAPGKELAILVNKQFAGQAEAEFLPDLNVLVVTAAKPEDLREINNLLMQFDRPRRSVAVEITVVDVLPQDKAPDDSEFTGSPEKVTAKLDALRKAGKIGEFKRVQLTALDGQLTRVRAGETKAFVVGTTVTGTGLVTRNVIYRDLGLSASVTPHVSADGQLSLDLELEEARAIIPEDGPAIGQDEKGNAVRAASFLQNTLKGRLVVPDGQVVLARGFKTTSKAGEGRMLVLVTATVLSGR